MSVLSLCAHTKKIIVAKATSANTKVLQEVWEGLRFAFMPSVDYSTLVGITYQPSRVLNMIKVYKIMDIVGALMIV